MTDRIGGMPAGFTPGLQPGVSGGLPGGQPAPMQGNFRGEMVQVQESPLSMLESAAEELTFGAHERMTRRELGELKIEDKGSRQLEQVERIQEYLESLPDLDQEKVRDMVERLLQRGEGGSQEGLKRELEGFHEDITYQQGALELMDDALRGNDDPKAQELRRNVQALMAENNRTMAPAIQAGLNITQTAMLNASDASEVQDLRNFYRESVLSHESLSKSWSNIVQRYGEGDLGGRIKFLLQALGADLSSRGPSIAPAELKAIVDETHQLATLSTIRERAISFFGRLQQRFGEAGA
jgi:type III secretion system YopN/LcrE/InvE/MxiC family regulator